MGLPRALALLLLLAAAASFSGCSKGVPAAGPAPEVKPLDTPAAPTVPHPTPAAATLPAAAPTVASPPVREDQCVRPPAGLVSWWTGDGNALDISGANRGTMVGGGTAVGMVGEGFRLDGVDDHVRVPDSASLNLRGDVTVDLWAKPAALRGDWTDMVVKGAEVRPGLYHETYVMGINPGNQISAGFTPEDGATISIAGPVVNDREFHHYAYVRKANHHKLYLDGVAVAGSDFTAAPADSRGLPLTIGGVVLQSGTGFHFNGIIDEVDVFNRALSDAEVQSIFRAGKWGKCRP